jgi:acyl dehydratase
MKFAQFHPGQIITLGPWHLSESSLLDFAREWDPQWFHLDSERAQTGPYKGLIASGWQTGAIAMRMVVDAILHDSDSIGSPGIEALRWITPVRAGDDLRLTATVLEVRTSQRRPELGIMRWRWQMHNQHGVEVMELTATSLFGLEPSAS